MFNLIKMHLYRLWHSMSTWVMVICTVGLAIFSVVMTNVDLSAYQEDPENPATYETTIAEESTGESLEVGIYVASDPEWLNAIPAGDLVAAQISSGLLLLLVSVFTDIFVHGEQKNGFIKNIAGQFPGRGKLVLSKAVVVGIQTLAILLLFTAACITTGLVLWGDKMQFNNMTEFIQYFGLQFLLHLGFGFMIMFFCTLTRTSGVGKAVGILISSGMVMPLFSLGNQLVRKLAKNSDFNIYRYLLDSNVKMLQIDSVSELALQCVTVGAVFIAVSVILSMLLMRKRDIKV